MVPKWGTSTKRDQNLIHSEAGQNTSTCKFEAIPLLCSQENAQKSQIWPVSLSQNAAKMRKINRQRAKSNQFSRWSGYINMSNFWSFIVTAIKKESTLSLMSPQRLNEKVQLKKNWQNCNFGQIRLVCLSNHLEISSRKIKSCCNNNLDEESTFNFSHYMDTRQSERCKFKEIAKIHILQFFTKLNGRHTWSLLIRCVNMKWVRLVLWKIHSGHDSVHRRADEQGETSTPPFNFVERGYNEKTNKKTVRNG